jgi:hypothetical protein
MFDGQLIDPEYEALDQCQIMMLINFLIIQGSIMHILANTNSFPRKN